jgi:glycosyltransferase involved in cell wall biosynthesis
LQPIGKMNKAALPFVSVIIPAYNAADTIAACVDSILAQNYPVNSYEIIVVNDASTDNTKALLDQYEKNRRINVIQHNKNRALAATRNTGIRASTGEILIFIDADITVLPDFISRHVQYYKDANIIGVLSQIKPGSNIKYDKYQRYLYESRRGAKKYPADQPLPYQTFLFSASSLRKSVTNAAGLFDENITRYGGEDTEFAYRISRHYPKNLFYAPEIEVFHHHYRRIEDVLKNVTDFGNYVVPYLVKKNPEFKHLYGYTFTHSNKMIKSVLGAISCSESVFRFLKFLYKIVPYPLSNLFVRCLLVFALWHGMILSKE